MEEEKKGKYMNNSSYIHNIAIILYDFHQNKKKMNHAAMMTAAMKKIVLPVHF